VTAFDVIVVGLGAAGASTAHTLAKRGLHVLGVDQFAPPHALGSSHGGSRIIREAYFEGSDYVPLVRRAYELWEELERESGAKLLTPTGGLTIGRPDGALVAGALRSARVHEISHELLDAKDILRLFPDFRPESHMVAVHERRAGVLDPEACVAASIAQAAKHGAEIRTGERVLDWCATDAGATVHVAGSRISAGSLVLAAGAWLPSLQGGADLGLWVERQVMHWFAPVQARAPGPVTVWELAPDRLIYTTPDLGEGSKIAIHHSGSAVSPDSIRRQVDASEVEEIEHIVTRYIPGLEPHVLRSATCMYTNTPDQHFLIDRHPLHGNVVIASACSGHGFKFAPAVGELAARLATDAAARTPDLFAVRRI